MVFQEILFGLFSYLLNGRQDCLYSTVVLGLSTYIDLLPHINLIDNFHYARNISLPGKISDKYDVIFNVLPPSSYDLNLHKDWNEGYGNKLFNGQTFRYSNVDFEEIAKANRD